MQECNGDLLRVLPMVDFARSISESGNGDFRNSLLNRDPMMGARNGRVAKEDVCGTWIRGDIPREP